MLASDAASDNPKDKRSGIVVWSNSSPSLSLSPLRLTCSLTSRLDYGWPCSVRATHTGCMLLFFLCLVPISLYRHLIFTSCPSSFIFFTRTVFLSLARSALAVLFCLLRSLSSFLVLTFCPLTARVLLVNGPIPSSLSTSVPRLTSQYLSNPFIASSISSPQVSAAGY